MNVDSGTEPFPSVFVVKKVQYFGELYPVQRVVGLVLQGEMFVFFHGVFNLE